jgi:glucokinase
MNKSLLIGDIGGTNARFAIAHIDASGFASEQTYQCAEFATVVDAIRQYLNQTGASPPKAICLAVAGPVVDGQVKLTNNQWTVSATELRNTFQVEAVWLLNDFEAIAYSIPCISIDEMLPVGHLKPGLLDSTHFTVAVLGAGTGLGAVGLRKYEEHYIAIVSEASHGGFAPENQEQGEILAVLRERFGRVSSERLVSGSGLENLYWALAQIQGGNCRLLSAAEIVFASMDEGDPLARKAVDLFYQILGQVAGDLALTLGANDGIYIAGGITQRYPQALVNSRFRSGFESKGRHRVLMERIPTQLIMYKQPGLLGAVSYAQRVASDDSSVVWK